MRRVALLLSLVLLAGGVGAASAQVPDGPPRLLLAPVPGVFQLPVAMAQHPDSDDLYVVEKVGRIRAVREGLIFDPIPVLDVSSEVSGGLEQGLLGLTFSPDGEFMYVYLTDSAGDTRVLEYEFSEGSVVAESRREVLFIDQPQANHNGGTIAFGPDGYLYIGLGDGGGAGDPDYNGQNPQTLLGSMLRIDPRASGDSAYTVPSDNPFLSAGTSGPSKGRPGHAGSGKGQGPRDPKQIGSTAVDALPEIWAYGLRNPWKYSFDRDTGDLWIADVGQSTWEELNLQRAASSGGENYGWNHMEGFELYSGRPEGAEEPEDHVPPIYAFPNAGAASCSVTGGYVYRGEAIPWLQGAYVYSDWCDGILRYIREEDGEVVEDEELGVTVPSIASFGEDHDGELYAISLGGAVFKILPGLP